MKAVAADTRFRKFAGNCELRCDLGLSGMEGSIETGHLRQVWINLFAPLFASSA